jgi:hypothetical protein
MTVIELDSEKRVQKKLKDIYDTAIEKDLRYDGSLQDLNYYNIVCKAASQDLLFYLMSNSLCMFKYRFQDKDSILMLFSIPITLSEKEKHISERIMDVIKVTEEVFITLDYVNSKEVKDDRYVYIVMVKVIDKEDEDNT